MDVVDLGIVEYREAWDLQRSIAADVDQPRVVRPAGSVLTALPVVPRRPVLGVRRREHHACSVELDLGVPDDALRVGVPDGAVLREAEGSAEPVDRRGGVLVRPHRHDPLARHSP
jgi:hypothetical protein